MKFSPYEARGSFAAPTQHFVQPGGLHYNNAGEQALAHVNAETASVIAKGFEDMREQYDSGKIMEANNEYNRLMSEGTAELMQKKQGEALNVVQDYDKLHAKTMEQVRKKFGQFINYGKAGQAFNIYTERDNNTRRQNMMKYQAAETEAYHDTQYNNQLATCMEIVGAGGYSDVAIEAGINRALPLIQDRYKNYGKEMIQNQAMAAKRGMVESALAFASSMSDYARMQDICNKYKDAISPAKMSATLAAIGKRQQEAQTLNFHEKMWADLGPGATPEQVEDWIEAHYQGKQRQGQQQGNRLPLYKQWDDNWQDVPFSQGTLGTSGCAPTSMAMAMSWATGKYINPVEVANYATENGLVASDGVHGADFVPAVAEHYGVEMRQTSDKEEVISLLQKGIPVVAAHDPGMFTDYGHFLVYSGIDANGRVMINDPNGGVRHSDDATFSLDEIFNQESADYYVIDSVPQADSTDVSAVYDNDFYKMDLEEAKKKALSDYQHRQNVYKATENITIGKAQDEMQDLMNQGVVDIEQYRAIVDKYAYNDHTRIAMEKTVSAIERRNEKAAEQAAKGAPSEKIDTDMMEYIEHEIAQGASKAEITEWLVGKGVTSDKELNRAYKKLDDYLKGSGVFKLPLSSIRQQIPEYQKAKGEAKAALGRSIDVIAKREYKKWLNEHNGNVPDDIEIIIPDIVEAVSKDFTETYTDNSKYRASSWIPYEETLKATRADLIASGYEPWFMRDESNSIPGADYAYRLNRLGTGEEVYLTAEEIANLKGAAYR